MTAPIEKLIAALVGRYEIERELGQGGMATVYLAQDMRHHRKVALKVLRPELSAILGGERFLHEIRTTANLQHPHILPLYDSGEADGLVFYVMPFVAGESLRDRLTRETQLPVEDAVGIAKEVADALDYAHRHGVIHRDIKPENILLHDGRAQVADFGIALAVSSAGGGTRMTETGMSLGTPHYMSPEQAMGEREISAKSDIYALGCVLYEMLVGEPPFTGPSAQAIIARVVTEEPRSLTLQRKSIPPHLEAVVRRALEKLPADRFQSAAQFAAALANPELVPLTGRSDGATTGRSSAPATGRRYHPLLIPVLGSLLVLAMVAAAWGWMRPRPVVVSSIARFSVSLPANATFFDASGHSVAMSPAGDRIVYHGINDRGERQLFVRSLDQLDAVPIPGTRDATQPFFSPDGRSIAFLGAGNKIQKVPLAGGPPLTIAAADSGFVGGSWGSGDIIVVGTDGGLRQVPAAGGRLAFLTRVDTARFASHRFPEFLPDGKAVLFQVRDSAGADHLAAVTLQGGAIKHFTEAGSDPRYVHPGHVLLSHFAGIVVAIPFDPSSLEVRGTAVPVAEGVAVGSGGAGKFGVSHGGALVYLTGSVGARSLVRVDRSGAVQPLSSELRNYQSPRYSPDGRSVAVSVTEGSTSSIWVFDVLQKSLTRLTFEGDAGRPFWTPDGSRIAFTALGAKPEVHWVRADGSSQAERLPGASGGIGDDWSRDGRSLVFHRGNVERNDIFMLGLDSGSTPRPYLNAIANEFAPAVSPDGAFAAYTSSESGRTEIYVRSFPLAAAKTQISLSGGTEPRWSRAGRELFSRNGDQMMVATVQSRPVVSVLRRVELFRVVFPRQAYFAQYDVAPDGSHFVTVQGDQGARDLIVVLNWFDQLRSKRGGAQRNTAGQ
ncbi:MAG: protein kinase domain-containing protein [Gemmatimonadaceae bacterium]